MRKACLEWKIQGQCRASYDMDQVGGQICPRWRLLMIQLRRLKSEMRWLMVDLVRQRAMHLERLSIIPRGMHVDPLML